MYYNSEMGKLTTITGSEDSEIIDLIFNNEIVVYEDIQGSKIWVNYESSKGFSVKSRSLSNDPINLIDLALQNYYNPAINYFESLSDRVKGLMPKSFWFCFEYFPDTQPANIQYQRMPKNGLVLSSIGKWSGKSVGYKYDCTIEEIEEYARLFDVDSLPIIFSGLLSDDMKEAITYFLNTSEKDLEYVFGESSFSFFFYKILSPQSKNSFLMNDDFQQNLQKIIINVKDRDLSFELLNPMYKRMSDTNSTDFTEIYSLMLVNFITFCQSINIYDIKLKGNKREEVYIYLICKLFNMYMSEVKEDILNFDFIVPEFFNKEKFKINKELINNKLTNELLDESPKIEYLFKILLGSFTKERKKAIGIFTDSTVNIFNKFVKDIALAIDDYLGKLRETELSKSNLVDFSQWFDIEYSVDGSNSVYPDIYDTFDKEATSTSKDKKKGYSGKKL